MSPVPPYFTATLSQALAFNTSEHAIKTRTTPYGVIQCHSGFTSVPEFVDFLARERSDHLALGCASPSQSEVEGLSVFLSNFESKIAHVGIIQALQMSKVYLHERRRGFASVCLHVADKERR